MNTKKDMKRMIALILFAGVLLASRAVAPAQTAFPGGTYTFEFSGDTSVWDVSGSYSDTLGDLGFVQFDYDVDAKGKITGTGSASGSVDVVDFDLDVGVTGSVTKSGSITRVTLTVKLTGSAYNNDNDRTYKASGTGSVRASVDTAALDLVGTISVKGSAAGHSASSGTVNFACDLGPNVDGSWSAPVTLSADSKGRITGSGTIDVQGGSVYSFGLTGSYNAKTGLASVNFKSADAGSKGASMKMTLQSGQNTLTVKTLAGSVMGQKVAQK
jgi:hypothetical protein